MIKTIFISSLFLTAIAAKAQWIECSQNEAQFIGKAKGIEYSNNSTSACSFEIEFSHYQESIVCPLEYSKAVGQRFSLEQCSLAESDAVSGILVEKNGVLSIEQ